MAITLYMKNEGGLNISDSPLFMDDAQATGQSYNYEYAKTGAITKVLSPTMLNVSPDTALKTLGLGQYHNADSDLRSVIRVADTKIQVYDTSTGNTTNQADDTSGAGTDFSSASSTQPVVFAPFNTVSGGTVLWMAGGGLPTIEGYTGTNITANGTPIPTTAGGTITASVNTHDSGVFAAPGTFFYGLQYRKLGTQVVSNVALDTSATIVNADDTVSLSWTLTNIDTTRYDQIIVWRSAISGVSGFTTGSIIAKLASTATTYKDTGTSIVDAQNVPRNGNTILDNSVLGSGTYQYLTAFKRRLVTCLNSTIYLSDLNKPESWPLVNSITIPSGGPITGLGVIGVPSEYTTGADEYLCIWKENELWVLTGESTSDWALLFVDKTGCAGQSLVVSFNSFVTWMGYSGIYIWDGRGRPSRCSRPIQALFAADGDLDKAKLSQGVSAQYEKGTQILWRVSHRTKGANKLFIKMDTRLTSLAASQNLLNPEMDGVFITDTDSNSYYGLVSFKPSNHDEMIISGDDVGFVYNMFSSASTPVLFDYETKPLDMGNPEVFKKYKRVIAYIERLTTNDLTLYYWADYRIRDEYRSKVVVSMSPQKGTQPALWDVALWDQGMWDDYTPDISPVEFNLHSEENNAEGLSLKLRFEQLEANAPVRIHGFAIEWEPVGNLSIPNNQIA